MRTKTVYKYPLVGYGAIEVLMPSMAQFIHFDRDTREDKLCLWAIVQRTNPIVKRKFQMVPTGGDIPDGARYLQSCVVGEYAWHLFEVN